MADRHVLMHQSSFEDGYIHPQVQIAAQPCKKEAICKPDPETLLFAGPKLISNRRRQSGNLLCAPIQKHGRCVLQTKEEWDHLATYRRSVQKRASTV